MTTPALCLILCSSSLAAGAAYFREEPGRLVLGNDLLETAFSPVDGAMLGLRRKGGREWLPGTPVVPFALSIDPGASTVWSAGEGDPAAGPTGPASHLFEEAGAAVRLVLDWASFQGTQVGVALTVRVEADSPWISFEAQVRNARPAGTVTTFRGPILAGLRVLPGDRLVWPARRGEIHSDLSGLREVTYPRDASMGWLRIGGDGEGLYYGVHDPTVRLKELRFGVDPDAGPGTSASARTWCFVPPSRSFQLPPVWIGPHAGDWHAAADRYRRFVIEAGWVRESAGWVRDLRGWSNLSIKDEKRVLLHRYPEIPARLLAVQPSMVDLLDVFGWHRDGFDTFYPDYVPLSDAGGEDGLREAIEQSHAHRDRVMFYFNSRLALPGSDWYSAHPGVADVRDRARDPVVEVYASRSFRLQCPSSPLWRSALKVRVTEMADRGSDGIWLDQLAGARPSLCYDPGHGHADPAMAFAGSRLLARDLRSAIGDGSFSCEGELDAVGDSVDIFGSLWFLPFGYNAADAPQVVRYTLPTRLLGLRDQGAAPGTAGYHATAFLLGCPFLDEDPCARTFLSIYDLAPRCFYRGRFLDRIGLTVSSPALRAGIHLADDEKGLAVAVWNPGPSATSAGLSLDLARLGLSSRADRVQVLPEGAEVGHSSSGSMVSFVVQVDAAKGKGYLLTLVPPVAFLRGDANAEVAALPRTSPGGPDP